MGRGKNAEGVFNKAVDLSDAAERAAFLDEACAGDEKLRAEVDALLRWHQEAGNFLEVPAVDPNVTLETSAVAEGAGTVIGRYKLLEKVGEGGMATVYMAEQAQPIRRRVALKVIKLGMDTKQVIARFEAERQALAMMDHPNIAKVLDAGTTDTGRPYFVMELVRGLPITEFCDKNNLTTKERLELFTSVCQAVQHAHQRGIIHRDIKPSNILVTLHDGEPVPKVIDFGIAKAVNQQLTEKTVFTRYSQMIGTPEYMSPEQAEMSGLDIDTRTDVFSLGVLLYELLTGMTPFDSEYLLSKGYSEMQRIIREEEPLRPSTKVSMLGETLTDVAKYRRTSPELLCKLIRTDLDWIVMKTLEKDRNRRYETAHALAEDIRRHLNDEPISAGSLGRLYHVRKFMRRNRSQLMAGAWMLILIMVLTVGALVFRVRAVRRFNAAYAGGLTQRLLDAQTTQVPRIIEEMAPYKKWTEPLLREAERRAEEANDSRQRLHCAMALLPSNPSQGQYLFGRLFEAEPEQLRVLADTLQGRPEASVDELWRVAEGQMESPDRRLRAACVLARHDPQNTRWSSIAQPVVEMLVEQNILLVKQWKDMLRPQHAQLVGPLVTVFRDRSATREIQRSIATEILADFAADQLDVLCSLLVDADPRQFRILFPLVQQDAERASGFLARELHGAAAVDSTEDARELLASRQANAAVALLRLGMPEQIWSLLRCAPDPRLRTCLIHRLQAFEVDPITVAHRLPEEADPGVRAGLILALSEYPFEDIASVHRAPLVERLLSAYRDDAESRIHSAAEYTLRTWGYSQLLRQIDELLVSEDIQRNQRWYINGQGQTLAVVAGPVEFMMGPGPSVPDRASWPSPIAVRIDRSFAMATKEVTQQQFGRFLKDYPEMRLAPTNAAGAGPDAPVRCTWYQAASYCRWLSEQEGIPEDQMCFPLVPQIGEGMQPYANYLDRTGYRLPSEAEWEYACRAGTTTRYCCGHSIETLSHYGWYHENANDVLQPVGSLKPNDFGLFDVHGGVWEYCYESAEARQRRRVSGDTICLDAEDTCALNNYVARVSRGGSFYDRPVNARSFVHKHGAPYLGSDGIRLVRTLPIGGFQSLEGRRLQAWGPNPANGTTVGVRTATKLSWSSVALGAKTHEVHFGTDPQALKSLGRFPADKDVKLEAPELEPGRTYCWRVDTDTSAGSTVTGNLWSFSTGKLVAWWQFDDPNSGTAGDSTGKGFEGKFMGDARVVFDQSRGHVLSLDGDGDYVDAGSGAASNLADSMTVAAWIKVNAFDRRCQAIVTKGDSEGWRLQRDNMRRTIEFACAGVNVVGASFNEIHGKKPVDDGNWHHLVGRYDGSTMFLHVDGQLDAFAAASGHLRTNSLPVLIGQNGQHLSREWHGLIDDVRIYDYALTDAEIGRLYADGEHGAAEP